MSSSCGANKLKSTFVAAVFLTAFTIAIIYFRYRSAFQLSPILAFKKVQSIKKPKQTYSAFYGLNHKDSYGQPLSFFDQHSPNYEVEDWKKYFSQLILTLKLLNRENPTANVSQNTKSFNVASSKTDYIVGEEFFATITSLDGEGRPKTFGGDYYRARLIKDEKALPDGIPCRIADNGDGTYSVKAPILLEGVLTLEVTLIIGVEGVNEIVQQSEKLPYWGVDYEATLENKEKTTCNMIITYDDQSGVCDYSNPRNREPWFCVQPSSKTCTKIIELKHTSKNSFKSTVDFIKICSDHHCYRKQKLNITVQENPSYLPSEMRKSSTCGKFSESDLSSQISGYFAEGQWRLLLCESQVTSLSFVSSCLSNKVIYLFGDSTIRKFFYLFVQSLKLQVDGPDNSVVWQQPKYAHDARNQHYNISMFYRAHGPPLLNPGPSYSRPYISDSIADIPEGGSHVYVIFNIGAHLYAYHPRFYLHRLKSIKLAILKHQKQFPDTRFIVRGSNVVEWTTEWQIYRFAVLLRETFSNMKNVAYLNFWDVTTVWPLDDYHPKPTVLDQQAVYMLSYICS